jgi:YD repeat-containing protein
MSRRTPSGVTMLFLLVLLTAETFNVSAVNGGTPPAQAQAKAQAERMIEGAQKGVTYDEAGRAVRTTVPTSGTEKVTVSLKYDKRNRIQAAVLDDGTQIGLIYDDSGQWQGYSFPDGGKMLFKRNAAGEIIGFTRVTRSARQRVSGSGRIGVRRVGFGAPLDDACASATASAVAAAVVAIANCVEGPSIPCATSAAAAVVAAVRAYEACKDKTSAAEESAA